MPLSLPDYRRWVASYESDWKPLDQTLYRLCAEHPGHDAPGAVNAKLFLIARGFATGLERHVSSDRTQGSSLGKVSRHFVANHQAIDEAFDRLKGVTEPLTLEALSLIVEQHGKFCSLVSQIARNQNEPASFSAKYMHFHVPAVPIFDDLAYKQAWKMRDKKSIRAFPRPEGAHEDFYWYTLSFWQVYEGIRKAGEPVNTRLAEGYLLWLRESKQPLQSPA